MNKINIPAEQLEELQAKIDNEGFHYAFVHYSSFEEVEDERFHELRTKFVQAAKELSEYLDMDNY